MRSVRLFLLLSLSVLVSAQPQPPRKTVGLVLAGGGALGLSHAGVLRWLEEHHIPVDYIAGTSMGGLMGGLWASGMSATEIDAFARQIDWSAALQSSAPYPLLSFRRKEDRRAFPNALELGVQFQPVPELLVPSGLSPGHGVGLVISRATAPYPDLASFDDLPTPFRTVATDLVEGKAVVFDRGPLFTALRATMSLPAIFDPVRQNGQVLVDGGLMNNVPTDVLQSMGPDVIIVVRLRTPDSVRKNLGSLLGIARRSIDVMIVNNERPNVPRGDVLIYPELHDVTTMQFERYAEVAQRGYDAAQALAGQLQQWSVPAAEYAAYVARRESRRAHFPAKIDFVQIQGVNALDAATFEKRLSETATPTWNRAGWEEQLTRITGLGRYESASYSVARRGGEEGLRVKVAPSARGRTALNTGLIMDAASGAPFRFGIGGRLTAMSVLNPDSDWRTDFSLGGVNRVATELYWRVRSSRFFLAPRAVADKTTLGYYTGKTHVADLATTQWNVGLDAGFAVSRFQELRVGYEIGHLKSSVTSGIPGIEPRRGTQELFRVRWSYAGQDQAIIPTRGFRAQAQADWFLKSPRALDGAYPRLEVVLGWAHPLGSKDIFLANVSGGTTIRDAAAIAPFTLGGPFQLGFLQRNQMWGDHYYLGNAILLHALSARGTFLGRFYGTLSYEGGRAFTGGARGPMSGGSAGLTAATPVGLFFVGGAVGERGERKLLFHLGRFF